LNTGNTLFAQRKAAPSGASLLLTPDHYRVVD
jgi:hypothetical protein